MKLRRVLVRLAVMLLGVVVLVGALFLAQFPLNARRVPDWAGALAIAAIALAVYALYERYVERRAPTEIGGRGLVSFSVIGTLAGVLLFAASFGLIAAFGAVENLHFNSWSGIGPVFLGIAAAALVEELIFRGFLFRTVRDLGGTWVGVGISALVFGAVHAFNPGATPASTVAIALEAGILLALAYAVANSLWLPAGIHLGWNFAESAIFGTAVSGHHVGATVLTAELQGPNVLTGGAFGPEASLPALVVCLTASAFLAGVLHRRERKRRA
ncbi:MAG: CPBP family intramembrane metalloprotease [Candidatus Eremiobacteraeota bacterium]|nr:CPBP family intramembrane metalloprotease [Candidatus Eremiobacteraeota bacterium]